MIKKILISFLWLSFTPITLAAELSCKEDYPKVIASDLDKLGQELKENNYNFIKKKTHRSLIQLTGGEQAFDKVLDLTQQMFARSNLQIIDVQSEQPLYSYVVNNEEICFIPKTTTINAAGKIMKAPSSFMVAIRTLDTHDWTYLDGAGLQKNPQMLYQLFPDFPKNVEVPFATHPSK